MNPRPLLVSLAGASVLVAGIGTAVAAHGNAHPAAPGKPATTATPANAAPGASSRSSRPVIVMYVFKGTIREKAPIGENGVSSLTLDLTGGNSHAKRLLAGAGVSIAGSQTHVFKVEVPTKTAVTKAGTTGLAAFQALAVNDAVLVKYRAIFKANAKGRPVGAQVQAFTLSTLDTTTAKRVQFLAG